jgi:hypothetical protein
MMRSTALAMTAVSMMVGACLDGAEDMGEVDDAELTAKTLPDPQKCPQTGCKFNKVKIGQWIHEVATTGSVGARLTSFTVAGTPVEVSYNDIVSASGAMADSRLRAGRMTINVGGTTHTVAIRDYRRVDYLPMTGDDRALFLDMQLVLPDGTLRPICDSTLMTGTASPAPADYVTMFTGDRYDLQTGEVSMPGTGYVTLACAGSPMARMHLERMTTAGARGSIFQPSLAARQQRFDELRGVTPDDRF